MPVARFEMPDGRIGRFEVPEGTTAEEAHGIITRFLGAGGEMQKEKNTAAQQEVNKYQSVTTPELIAANPIARAAVGAASPILGVMEQFGMTSPEGRRQLQAMQARGNEALGMGAAGTISDIAGSVLSPAWLGAAKAMPLAATLGQKAVQGSALGALGGLTTPENQMSNAAVGMALGGAIPPLMALGGVGIKTAANLVPGIRKENLYLKASGDKANEIIDLLRKNEQLVPGSMPTAGQAAAPAGRAEFSALQAKSAARAPSLYASRTDEQSAAQLARIREVGRTAEELDATLAKRSSEAKESYDRVRDVRIDPRSDEEIMRDAISGRAASKGEALRDWGRFATSEAQNQVRADTFTPVPGMPRVAGTASNFPERIQEAKAAAYEAISIARQRYGEEQFLNNTLNLLRHTVGMDSKGLQNFIGRPSFKEAIKDAMKSAQENGQYFPTQPGDKFSIGNFQRIKESLDAGIAAAKKSTDAGRRPELSPQELEATKSEFVKWLSNKSPEWRDARLQYLQNSQPINKMQVGQYLEGVATPTGYAPGAGTPLRESSFLEAIRKSTDVAGDEAAKRAAELFAKRATGNPRFKELTDVLDPPAMKAVADVAADFSRNRQYIDQALRGVGASPELKMTAKLPNMLMREAMVMNAIIGKAEGKINEKLAAEIAVEMLNPPGVAESLHRATRRAAMNKARADALGTWAKTLTPGMANEAGQ